MKLMKQVYVYISIVVAGFALMISYQNCSQVSFSIDPVKKQEALSTQSVFGSESVASTVNSLQNSSSDSNGINIPVNNSNNPNSNNNSSINVPVNNIGGGSDGGSANVPVNATAGDGTSVEIPVKYYCSTYVNAAAPRLINTQKVVTALYGKSVDSTADELLCINKSNVRADIINKKSFSVPSCEGLIVGNEYQVFLGDLKDVQDALEKKIRISSLMTEKNMIQQKFDLGGAKVIAIESSDQNLQKKFSNLNNQKKVNGLVQLVSKKQDSQINEINQIKLQISTLSSSINSANKALLDLRKQESLQSQKGNSLYYKMTIDSYSKDITENELKKINLENDLKAAETKTLPETIFFAYNLKMANDPEADKKTYGYDQNDKDLCDERRSPLIISLDNSTKGIGLTSILDGIKFDIMGSKALPSPHYAKQISWFKQGNTDYYFLALPNHGVVEGIDQLFGDNTLGPDGKFAANGYLALAKYDLNNDKLITSLDPIFKELRLWKDVNRDGKSEPDELFTLDEMGIIKIDLNYDNKYKEVDKYGNATLMKSVVQTKDGKLHLIFDLWFRVIHAL